MYTNLKNKIKHNKRLAIPIALFAVVGVAILAISGAAPLYSGLEVEDGTRTPNAERIADGSASSGSAVRFGAQSTGGDGTFRVEGGDIIDPSGEKFVPIGANVGPRVNPSGCYAFTADGCRTAEGHSDDALEWGWNMIRVNTTADHGADANAQSNIEGVQRIIDEYTPKGIVVMPTVHSWRITGTNLATTNAIYSEVHTFWDAIIERNKDNPYVWINYVNEPSADPAQSNPFWRNLGDQLYNRVRTRTNNLFVYDLPIYGQQINELAETNQGESFLQNKQNVVFSWHNYGGAIKFNQGWAHGTPTDMTNWAQQVVNKNLPVLIGEFGRSSEASTPISTHGGQGLQIDNGAAWTFDNWWQYGFGGLWWHGTGTPENWDLRMNGTKAWYNTNQPLSASGQRLKDIPSQRPPGY